MDVKAELTRRLAAVPEILFAFLFGSRARDTGRPRPNSDWDVAIYLRDELTPRERFKLQLRLFADLEDLGRIDIIVLNDAPPLLAHRAAMGERLVVRDEVALVRFIVRAVAVSEDMRHWREVQHRARRQRIEERTVGRP